MTLQEEVANVMAKQHMDGTKGDYWQEKAQAAIAVFAKWLKNPSAELVEKVRDEMPVEYRYWQAGGMLHAEMLGMAESVPPQNILEAVADYLENKNDRT